MSDDRILTEDEKLAIRRHSKTWSSDYIAKLFNVTTDVVDAVLSDRSVARRLKRRMKKKPSTKGKQKSRVHQMYALGYGKYS